MLHDTFDPVTATLPKSSFGMKPSARAAGARGAADALSRRVEGVRLNVLRADLLDWQPLARPTLARSVQLTVDLQPGGWRRGAATSVDAVPYATRADGVSLESLDPPTPVWMRGRFEMLTMIMERDLFDAFADQAGVSRGPTPFGGMTATDPVIGGMARTLAEALTEPVREGESYIAPLMLAVIGRVLSAHLREAACKPRTSGSLAPWQERKAKALLSAHMADEVSIVDVARECRLSRSHFCKAFKQTTGQSPYAWLTHQRISTAQSLLRGTQTPLAEIALACGFGDQSHLTRMFSRMVGTPPGSWRRSLMR